MFAAETLFFAPTHTTEGGEMRSSYFQNPPQIETSCSENIAMIHESGWKSDETLVIILIIVIVGHPSLCEDTPKLSL